MSRPPGSGAWWFQRVSGALLIVFVALHFVDVHFVRGLENIDFDDVAAKWNQPLWRVADAILLGLAMWHGTNGMEGIVEEIERLGDRRRHVKLLMRWTAILVTAIGAWVLLTFSPGSAG